MAVFHTAMRVCVLGGGSWGTTVASLAAHNTETMLWCRDEATVQDINPRHVNGRYLEGYDLHPNLQATNDLEQAVRNADLLVMGIPSHSYRETLSTAAPFVRPWVPVLSLTKGLEQGTRLRMSEVTNEVLPGHPAGALTGERRRGWLRVGRRPEECDRVGVRNGRWARHWRQHPRRSNHSWPGRDKSARTSPGWSSRDLRGTHRHG